MARPVIALLTDFGLQDHYVGALKAVILSIARDATLLDITHDIPPQDIVSGALELEAVVAYLPKGTVVVGVVDPGVGTDRRGIVVQAGTLTFVGPDNGLFALALRRHPAARAVELGASRFALPAVGHTFEGRDRFAPAAAWLATGTDLAELGPPAAGLLDLPIPQPVVSAAAITGEVVRVDRFGNLITNVLRATVPAAWRDCSVDVCGRRVDGVAGTYADAPVGSLCALFGSADRLEIAVTGGSAAGVLGAGRGTPVQVRPVVGA